MTRVPRAYTTIEVAKRLGISLQTVQRWVDAGHLKAWKTVGGHRRIEATCAELPFKEQLDRIGTVVGSDAVADIHMPHMNRFEMIRQLLDIEPRPLTLIAISALPIRALAAVGCLPSEVQVFTKPLDRERFSAALRCATKKGPALQGQGSR